MLRLIDKIYLLEYERGLYRVCNIFYDIKTDDRCMDTFVKNCIDIPISDLYNNPKVLENCIAIRSFNKWGWYHIADEIFSIIGDLVNSNVQLNFYTISKLEEDIQRVYTEYKELVKSELPPPFLIEEVA